MLRSRRSPRRLAAWVAALLLLLAGPLLGAQAPAGAPVVFQGETLFHVRTRVGSFPPEVRARTIAERLEELSHNPFAPPEPLRVDTGGPTADLYSGPVLILSVTDEDAALEQTGRLTLAHT